MSPSALLEQVKQDHAKQRRARLDSFATAAMAAICQDAFNCGLSMDDVASDAYRLAQAMETERAKQP